MTGQDTDGRKVAVVVVHGVGKCDAGDNVNHVADCLHEATIADGSRGSAISDLHNEVNWLEVPPEQKAQPTVTSSATKAGGTFPVYTRKIEFEGGAKASVFELYWSDLTRQGEGLVGMVVGFGGFIFGIPHVIDGFLLNPPGPISRFYRWLLLWITGFVRGPVAGYCLVMLAGGITYLAFKQIPEREDVSRLLAVVVAMLPSLNGWLATAGTVLAHPGTFHSILLAGLGLGASTTGFLAWRLRNKNAPVATGLGFVAAVAAFYLVDAAQIHPNDYKTFKGISYFHFQIVALLAIATAGLYFTVSRHARDVGFGDLGLSSTLWALGFALHMIFRSNVDLTGVGVNSSTLHFRAFESYYFILSWLWGAWGLLTLVATVLALGLLAFNFWRWEKGFRGIFAALALVVLQACVWLTVVPALAVMHMDSVLCDGSVFLPEGRNIPLNCERKLKDNASINGALRALEGTGQTIATGSVLSEFVRQYKERLKPVNEHMLRAVEELSVSVVWNGTILFAFVGISLLVVLWRKAHVMIMSKVLRANGKVPFERLTLPRLIISSPQLILLTLFGLMNAILCVSWLDLPFASYLPPWFSQAKMSQIQPPPSIVQMALIGAAVIAVVAQSSIFTKPLSGVQHILQDLINHQYRASIGVTSRFNPQVDLDKRQRRRRIDGRVDTLVRRLIMDKGFDEVVFLAHSQGTVIVFDYLSSDGGREALKKLKVHVVTAGSPLGQLYEYYFDDYSGIAGRMEAIEPAPASWTNFYRVDDPIAGRIGAADHVWTKLHLVNRALGEGGHLQYWSQPEVRDEIRGLLKVAR